MKNIVDNIVKHMLAGETFLVEVVLAWFLFNWGVWILLPFSNFVSPVAAWDGILPSVVFSVGSVAIALAALVGAGGNVYLARRGAAFAAAVLWLSVGSSMLLTGQHDHVAVLYLCLSAASFWLHVRVRFQWLVT